MSESRQAVRSIAATYLELVQRREWCCVFDWNAGTFRTTPECITRTMGANPKWVAIVAEMTINHPLQRFIRP